MLVDVCLVSMIPMELVSMVMYLIEWNATTFAVQCKEMKSLEELEWYYE